MREADEASSSTSRGRRDRTGRPGRWRARAGRRRSCRPAPPGQRRRGRTRRPPAARPGPNGCPRCTAEGRSAADPRSWAGRLTATTFTVQRGGNRRCLLMSYCSDQRCAPPVAQLGSPGCPHPKRSCRPSSTPSTIMISRPSCPVRRGCRDPRPRRRLGRAPRHRRIPRPLCAGFDERPQVRAELAGRLALGSSSSIERYSRTASHAEDVSRRGRAGFCRMRPHRGRERRTGTSRPVWLVPAGPARPVPARSPRICRPSRDTASVSTWAGDRRQDAQDHESHARPEHRRARRERLRRQARRAGRRSASGPSRAARTRTSAGREARAGPAPGRA